MSRAGNKEEKYNAILNAAVRVFAQHGFFNSRVSQIAREANVADGTIYLYFKNKDDILISLFEKKMSEIIETIGAELAATGDVFEKIAIYIRAYFRLVRENQELAEVITLELRQSTKFMKEYDNKKFVEYLNLISRVLHEGIEKKAIRPGCQPRLLKRMLFGMMDELTLYWVLKKSKADIDLDRMANEVIQLFIDGIRNREPQKEASR